MNSRATWLTLTGALCLALLLGACSSAPRKQIFPPAASLQQLSLQSDGSWLLQLRIQSFSNVPHRIEHAQLQLDVEGIEAARLELPAALDIGPHNAEVENLQVRPSAAAAARLEAALEQNRSLRYSLSGHLHSSAPKRRDDAITFEGQLWPTPGLPGVLR